MNVLVVTSAGELDDHFSSLGHKGLAVRAIRVDSDFRYLLVGAADAILITDDLNAEDVVGCVKRIRATAPAVPIVAYVTLNPSTTRLLMDLAVYGIEGVVFRGAECLTDSLRRIAISHPAGSVRSVVISECMALSSEMRSLVTHLVLAAVAPTRVDDVARELRIPRRTLVDRLARANLPAPSAIIAWGRVLHGTYQLQDRRHSVETIGLTLGFGSGSGLRNMLRRYTLLTPSEVRKPDGWQRVVEQFHHALCRGVHK